LHSPNQGRCPLCCFGTSVRHRTHRDISTCAACGLETVEERTKQAGQAPRKCPWECTKCTFRNPKSASDNCEMCAAPKETASGSKGSFDDKGGTCVLTVTKRPDVPFPHPLCKQCTVCDQAKTFDGFEANEWFGPNEWVEPSKWAKKPTHDADKVHAHHEGGAEATPAVSGPLVSTRLRPYYHAESSAVSQKTPVQAGTDHRAARVCRECTRKPLAAKKGD
jgi:hypothetical protein